ncbi:hypothetical protein K502DRAFT_323373 [Neoconidiobolus thromboides FSU 785]|nr:hypothetical protein K502DRAFT_323373 [Neoconidiobolus thromboides FSU 785]
MEDSVLNWSIDHVASWLGTIGYNEYIKDFKEEGITGEVLVNLDHETLNDLNIKSVGKRILLLKAIYELKIRFNIPIYSDDYAPPNTIEEVNYQDEMFGGYHIQDSKIVSAFKERDAVIKHLVHEISKINSELIKIREMNQRLASPDRSNIGNIEPLKPSKYRPSPIVTTTSKSSSTLNSGKPFPISPHSPNFNSQLSSALYSKSSESNQVPINDNQGSMETIKPIESRQQHQRENEAYKSLRIFLDDPCHKVIPAALRKYKINDDWKNYSIYISQANGIERKLEMEEKPLKIYQKLKEANASPVFVLKHNTKGKVVPNMTTSPITPGSASSIHHPAACSTPNESGEIAMSLGKSNLATPTLKPTTP